MSQTNRWEYRIEALGSAFRGVKEFEQEALLNEWGVEGWEVFHINNPQGSNKVIIYAKRPLTGSTRRPRTRSQEDW